MTHITGCFEELKGDQLNWLLAKGQQYTVYYRTNLLLAKRSAPLKSTP